MTPTNALQQISKELRLLFGTRSPFEKRVIKLVRNNRTVYCVQYLLVMGKLGRQYRANEQGRCEVTFRILNFGKLFK